MVGTIVHQLTDGCSAEELEKAGLGAYYTDHGVGVYPQAAAGFPFTASVLAVKGDPIADLQEDLAAEQKARATYEKLIDLCKDDQDVLDPLRFLKEIAENAKAELNTLWNEVKRMKNPHKYYVDLSQELWNLKDSMLHNL